jgi:hypothetical protein
LAIREGAVINARADALVTFNRGDYLPMVHVHGEPSPQATNFLRAEAPNAPGRVTYRGHPEPIVLTMD